MLIECMIQLPQKNSISGIVCILLERKPLAVIISISAIVLRGGYCAYSNYVSHVKPRLLLSIKPFWKLRSRSVSLTGLVANQIASVVGRS